MEAGYDITILAVAISLSSMVAYLTYASSGQAANFFALFNLCEAGDHIVASSTIYGAPSTSSPSP